MILIIRRISTEVARSCLGIKYRPEKYLRTTGAIFEENSHLISAVPDHKGLDAAIADFIFRHDGNILHFEQHQAGEERFYLARVEWDLSDFKLKLEDFSAKFDPIADKFSMHWRLAVSTHRPRVWRFSYQSLTIAWWTCCTGSAMASWRAKSPVSSAIILTQNATPIFTASRITTSPS